MFQHAATACTQLRTVAWTQRALIASERMGTRLLHASVLAAALAAPAAVFAQSSEDPLVAECYSLRRAGRLTESIARCEQAVALTHSGRSLAQLALTEVALERWSDAATHLEAALADASNPWVRQNRASLDESLRTVRTHVVAPRTATPTTRSPAPPQASVEPRTASATPPPVIAPPRRDESATPVTRTLAWIAAGGAVAGFGVALLGWRLREGEVSGFSSRCPDVVTTDAAHVSDCGQRRAQLEGDVRTWEALSTVGLVAGGALAVTSAVLFATSSSGASPSRTSLACGAGPGVLGVRCAVRF